MSRFIYLFIFAMIFAPLADAKMRLQIIGLKGELDNNVQARLSTMDESTVENTPQFKRYLTNEVKKGLRALGYYSPTLTFSVHKSRFSSKPTLKVRVEPGPPILIERVSVNLSGQGQDDKDYIQLLRDKTPMVGDVLNHGVYDSFKKDLQRIALRKGYFDAEFTRNQLAVSEPLREAFWRIDFNTGQRYRLGQVRFKESFIDEEYLRNIIPFEEGEEYTSEKLGLLSRRLSSTNWFNSVSVLPIFSKVDEDKVLPIYISTIPRKPNIIDVGIGYSTDIGVRGKLGWSKPWLNRSGHSFNSNLSLSEVEQVITASYKIPLVKSPLEYYYTIQSGFKHENNNDTKSDSYSIGLMRNWDNFDGWQKTLGINASYDEFTQANDSHNTFLIYPSISFYRARQEGGVLPMWGDSQRYSFEIATDYLGSDISFWSIKAQQVWIRSLYDEHRFIARINFGLIETHDFEKVPPSFRFFAGGDRSVRGYSYQSISPRDSTNKLTGASRLLTGSLEYQYRLADSWWGAVFADSGEAINSFNHHDFHTGTGVGVRWVSPIGPIKMDVATPINRSKTSVHFYIGIGAEL